MTAIDHTTPMLDAIEVAKNVQQPDVAQHHLGLAQVHATALLAEQQRIANLIAALGAGASLLELQDATKATNARTRERMVARNEIREDISKGLGLS